MDISSQQISDDLLKQLTRSELYKLIKAEQSVRLSMQEQLVELQSLNTEAQVRPC
jgi:hypothetical protein